MTFYDQFDFEWRPDPLPPPGGVGHWTEEEGGKPAEGDRTVAVVAIVAEMMTDAISVNVAPHPKGGWFVRVGDEWKAEESTYRVTPSKDDEFPTLG